LIPEDAQIKRTERRLPQFLDALWNNQDEELGAGSLPYEESDSGDEDPELTAAIQASL